MNEIPGSSENEGESIRKAKYPCELCPELEPFKNRNLLISHKIKIHGGNPFQCAQCEKTTFTNPSLLREHQKRHGIRSTFKCEVEGCANNEKVFLDRATLHRHHRSAHSGVNKPFQCETCELRFWTKGNLTKHQKIVHQGLRPFMCDICGESFTTSMSLENHKLIHTGERPHQCPICGQRFRTDGVLGRHVKGLTEKGDSFKPNGPMKHIRKRVSRKK